MVFTQRPFGHTFHVWRRGLALVESLVVQTSLASFWGGVVKTFRCTPEITLLDYVLNIRAFFNTTSKQKAERFVAATFPELPVSVVGTYWKDDSLTEATLGLDIEYCDDKTALWETMRYFMNITCLLYTSPSPRDRG